VLKFLRTLTPCQVVRASGLRGNMDMHDTNSVRLLGRDLSRVPGIRTRVILVISLAVVLSFLVAAGVLLWHMQYERHIMLHQGLSASVAAINPLDREVGALGNTLRELAIAFAFARCGSLP
jgi:two-component system, NarL family, sensor kinase